MRIGRATADRGTPGQRRSKGRGGMRRALRSGAAAGAVAGAAGALGVTLLPAISGAFATPAWASPATQAAVAPTASAPVAASGLLESSRGSGVVAVATSPTGGGWYAYANGAVGSFGGATNYGSMAGKVLNRPIVGIAANYLASLAAPYGMRLGGRTPVVAPWPRSHSRCSEPVRSATWCSTGWTKDRLSPRAPARTPRARRGLTSPGRSAKGPAPPSPAPPRPATGRPWKGPDGP